MKKQNIAIVAIIVLLLAVGAGMNYVWERNQVSLDEDGNPIPNITTPVAPVTPPSTRAVPPVTPVSSAPATPAKKFEPLPSELSLGKSKAQTIVALAYISDSHTHIDPELASEIVESLKGWSQSRPDVQVKIVDLSLPLDKYKDPADLHFPVGLSINRTPVAGLNENIGQDGMTPGTILTALGYVK